MKNLIFLEQMANIVHHDKALKLLINSQSEEIKLAYQTNNSSLFKKISFNFDVLDNNGNPTDVAQF